MQYTEETNGNNRQKRERRVKWLVLFFSLFAFIIGATIIKNNLNYNTNTVNNESFEYAAGARRVLVSGSDKQTVGDSVYVKIGGTPIGISVNAGGLIVIGQSEVVTEYGTVDPAAKSGLQVGDVVRSINGEALASIYQLKKFLETIEGAAKLTVARDGRVFDSYITPALDKLTGQKRLGLLLKEDIGGVGTLTFVTKEGQFGALGHYIADGESGLSYELNSGHIYATSIDGVVKGERGKAGGLVADVNRLSKPIGDIDQNTDIGIYGDYTSEYGGALYRIAAKGEAKIGPAKVLTTIDGTQPKFYDIDIVKVVSQSEAAEKGMVIAVRDKELLERTGGIVQGMSGSPIVQDGILIGAVTHVFVQDPTRGYAVHSRFMYEYATNSQNASSYIEAA